MQSYTTVRADSQAVIGRWVVLVGSFAAGFGTVYLFARLWPYRERPGARWFLASMVAQTTWCLSYAVALLVFDPTLRLALELLTLVAMPWTAVCYLGFALGYTGRTAVLSTWLYRVPLALTVGSNLLVLSNGAHGLVYRGFDVVSVAGLAGTEYTHEPGLFVVLAFATLWVVLGVFLLFDTVLSYGPLFRREALAVGTSATIPGITLLLWLFGFGPAMPALNLTPLLFLPHVVLDVYAFVGNDMFEFLPGTRRAGEQAAIRDLGTPVVIVDTEGRVVTLNAAAESLVDADERAALTQSLSSLLDTDVDPDAGEQRLSIAAGGERRQYDVTPARLTDPGGDHVGYTLVFQDVTEAVRREQRLTVMNRVLRHNLRNDLTVVKGYVEAANDRIDDPEIESMLSTAATTADDLVATGATVRDIETAIGTDGERTTVNLDTLVRSAVDDASADSDDAVAVSVPEGLTVEAEPDVLALVLTELVENALAHGDDPVSVAVDRTAEGVEVVVADAGPGIPDHELSPLRSGTETDLDHGSGLGLWVVQWGVDRLGGTVAFDTDHGTTVLLTLPATD